MTYNATIELTCGCVRSPRAIPKTSIPAIKTVTECMTHGAQEVIHTAYVSN